MSDRKKSHERSRLKAFATTVGLAVALVAQGAWGQPAAHPTPKAPLPNAAPQPAVKAPAGGQPGTPPVAPDDSSPHGNSPKGDSPHGDSPHGDAQSGDSPHGDSPHGHMGAPSGRGNMGFEPLPDGAEADPTLAPGTIVISIRNADDVPLEGVDLVLGILHNSVAKGESRERKEARTDGTGSATFTDLGVGQAHQYHVTSTVGPGTFEVPPFQLTDKVGMRVVLHLYEVTEDVSRLRVAMRGTLSVSLKEDVMAVDVTYNIFNVSPSAWLADVEIPLPKGYRAFNTSEEMSGALKVLPTEHGAVLRGTIPPGQSDVGFRFHVPLSGDEAQDVDFSLFPHTLQTQVAVEASKKMRLSVEGFPPAQFQHTQDGRSYLFTTRSLQAGPIDHFKATIGGLPTRGPGSWIAVALAVLAVGTAFGYRAIRVGRTDLSEDAYQDLIEARETLIEEIKTLERAHLRGTVGPKTYARARTLLTDALARIMIQLEHADATRKPPQSSAKKPGGPGPTPPTTNGPREGKPKTTTKRRPAEASA